MSSNVAPMPLRSKSGYNASCSEELLHLGLVGLRSSGRGELANVRRGANHCWRGEAAQPAAEQVEATREHCVS